MHACLRPSATSCIASGFIRRGIRRSRSCKRPWRRGSGPLLKSASITSAGGLDVHQCGRAEPRFRGPRSRWGGGESRTLVTTCQRREKNHNLSRQVWTSTGEDYLFLFQFCLHSVFSLIPPTVPWPFASLWCRSLQEREGRATCFAGISCVPPPFSLLGPEAAESVKKNVAPLPISDSTQIRPP